MKTLLFTGASGFLGANTLPVLQKEYQVDTLGFAESDTYCINLAKKIPDLLKQYDIVLHAAGKAHVVPKTDEEKKLFYDVNLQGTKNLCYSLEKIRCPKSFIFISTVAVYGCETGELITENHSLDGTSPYADSKKQTEFFLQEWAKKNSVYLTILRPSLLAGKNPPGNLGAMIKGINTGRYLSIAGGRARKSVAMASDIAELLPLCENKSGIYNLCDSHNPSFHELEKLISSQLKKKLPLNIPIWLANFMAFIGNILGSKAPINSAKLEKITKSLTFSNDKIIKELGFIPTEVLSEFIIK